MNHIYKMLVTVCVLMNTVALEAQILATGSMMQDFPQLMNKYGDMLDEQHAHYIFAVDISSSMQQYEATVKANFLDFIKAIPDGDKVTLIRMADKEHTNYLGGMYKCITLNSDVRNDLQNIIYSDQFRFLNNGHPHDGSDGYRMAELVIDAINTIGSNDLTFVYMFTDFEYWTEEYRYNPSREDWNALKEKMPKEKQFAVCKYGLELHNNTHLNQQAIIKNQLDEVFGTIDYQSVTSAEVLSQWFGHSIANVMAVKLNSLVKRDWSAFEQSVQCNVIRTGLDVEAVITCDNTDLVKEFHVTPNHNDSNFKSSTVVVEALDSINVVLGQYVIEPSAIVPSYKNYGGSELNVDIAYMSHYADELHRLQELCKDVNKINSFSTYEFVIPKVQAWNSFIPLWAWIVLGVILFVIILSVLYTVFGIRFDREWQLSVTRRDADGNRLKEYSSLIKAPVDIKSYKDKKPVNDWVVKLYTKKYNPLNILKLGKTGYYVTLEQGSFLDVVDPYDLKNTLGTITVGEEYFVCSHRKVEQIILHIKTSGNQYKIEII